MPEQQEYHDKTFANRLSIFRKQYIHKSQRQAALKLEINQATLSNMENQKSPIKLEFITKLVKEYQLNQDWFTSGTGKPTDKNPPKGGLVKDINLLNEDLELLKKQIGFMEANQSYMLKIIERQDKKIAALQKKLDTQLTPKK